jgi:hypothetical protein
VGIREWGFLLVVSSFSPRRVKKNLHKRTVLGSPSGHAVLFSR